MRIVRAAYASGRELLHCYSLRRSGAILDRTRAQFDAGEPVLLEVDVVDRGARVTLRATAGSFDAQRGGRWMRLAQDDHVARDFLLALARGKASPRNVRHQMRFPIELTVDWQAGGRERYVSQAADVSAGGMFLRTLTPAPAGSEVALRFRVEPLGEMIVPAHVAWVRTGDPGMGLTFARGDRSVARLRGVLRRASDRGRLDLSSAA